MATFNSSTSGERPPLAIDVPIDEYECTDEECFDECHFIAEEPTTEDIILMSVRCAVTVVTIVLIVLVFVNVARGIKVKSWRLYLLTSLTLFAWLGMSLYQDHFDRYYVNFLVCEVQTR